MCVRFTVLFEASIVCPIRVTDIIICNGKINALVDNMVIRLTFFENMENKQTSNFKISD